jgi:hypothetical protein
MVRRLPLSNGLGYEIIAGDGLAATILMITPPLGARPHPRPGKREG